MANQIKTHVPKGAKSYPLEKKKRLATKISSMRDRKHLRVIKKIIVEENPDININKNSGGMLMFFENCSYNTYVKLDKYLQKIDDDKFKSDTNTDTNTDTDNESDYNNNSDTNSDYSKARTRLRYSNREKRLIKRQTYEKIISEKLDVNTTTNTTTVTSDNMSDTQNSANPSDNIISVSNISQTSNTSDIQSRSKRPSIFKSPR